MYQAVEEFVVRSPGWVAAWRWSQDATDEAALGRLPVAPLWVAVAPVLPGTHWRIEQELLGFGHVRHTLRTSYVILAHQRTEITQAVEHAGGYLLTSPEQSC
jgi:hypothetical protein